MQRRFLTFMANNSAMDMFYISIKNIFISKAQNDFIKLNQLLLQGEKGRAILPFFKNKLFSK